jgi:hypothetical protein
MLSRNTKRTLKALIFLVIIFSAYRVFAFFSSEEPLDFAGVSKTITLSDNGLNFKTATNAGTVADFLREKNIKLGEHDKIIPERDEKIRANSSVEIARAAKIKITVDGKTIEKYVLGKNVKEALQESQVTLGRLDKTAPALEALAENDLKIIVTRINVEEIVKKEDIDFKTTVKNDAKLGWREKKIETKGEKGIKEVKYKITYKDGKEISRVKLETNILKEPVTQVETQGTYMKLGSPDKGQGTWYAWKGGLFAASTTIPKGEYAKVTNTANGKSVVVEINDYGPQGKGRIIDLDKVAFAKIASLGAGVIGVKVERVLN